MSSREHAFKIALSFDLTQMYRGIHRTSFMTLIGDPHVYAVKYVSDDLPPTELLSPTHLTEVPLGHGTALASTV